MKKGTILFFSVLLLLNYNAAAAQFSKAGTASAQFLKIGIGARAMAMGGAYGALADDASALYWNPAGIALADKPEFCGSYTEWFADITHQFVGVVLPVSHYGVIGISAVFLSMDDMEITTIEEPRGTGEYFSAHDLSIGLSYARMITDRFSIGFTGKYISQAIYNETATGLGIDIGTRLITDFHGLVIAMNFSNIGNKMQLSGRDLLCGYDLNPNSSSNLYTDAYLNTESWALPTNFKVSICMDIIGEGAAFFSSANHNLVLGIDGNHPTDGPERASIGLEYQWRQLVVLRSGYKINYSDETVALGIGLKQKWGGKVFTFDYAYLPFNQLNDVQMFSISYRL
ncbi:PorV/PorQ family protein [bacterium]|nr:PorV/PorQ family protein [bacterium]MBU1634106.1 PorV/PorQ family protein [bacterium]MBU1872529.1 PorV/PorQ family protein [bacterium]